MAETKTIYEFAFVLRQGESEEIVASALREFGADLITTGPIQDIQLAYPIKKSLSGRFGYYHVTFSDSSAVEKITQKLQLDDRVLRFLFVKVPKKRSLSAKEAKPRRKIGAAEIPSVAPAVSHLDSLSNEKLEQTLEEILK